MKQSIFNKLPLEKRMEIYNEWLIINYLDEYVLYTNDDEGIELCLERNMSAMCSSDRLVMYDRDIPFGFKSLTDADIDGYFNQKNFLDWVEGQKVGDYNV